MVFGAFEAKLASMVAIGVGSFIVGVAPACFVSRVQELQQRLLLSCTLCFGGGVLLATSLLHMLPEVRERLPNYAELVFACGFLLLYLVDELVHYLWDNDVDRAPIPRQRANSIRDGTVRDNAGRCREHSHQVGFSAATQSVCMPDGNSKLPYQSGLSGNVASNNRKATSYGAVQCSYGSLGNCCKEEATTLLCHGNHSEPCTDSHTGLVGLLLALTVHAILEGLAVGLQKHVGEVLLLVAAVASHKFVVGFCLGLELAGAESSVRKLILAIFVFAGGSSLGIGIGMLTFKVDENWLDVVLPILQGLAGGTLLYVTVSEVLPRERARWHRTSRRSAGIIQFLSTAMGFVIIFLLNKYVGET